MKKIVASVLAASLICTSVCAAPTKNEFYNKNTFIRNFFAFIMETVNKNAQTDKPGQIADDKKDDTQTDTNKRLTMSDVVGGICIVSNVSRSSYIGEDAVKITYYANGNETARECYFVSSSRNGGVRFNYDDITVGSLIYVSLRTDATVSKYAVMSVVGSNGIPVVDENSFKANFSTTKAASEFSYITDTRARNGNTVVTLGNGEVLVIDKNTFCYTFDNTAKNAKVTVGDFMAGNVDSPNYDETTDTSTVYYVYAVTYDGETKAICSFAKADRISGNAGN